MANFTAPPSWFTTLIFMGHVLMPSKIKAKGFQPLSLKERESLSAPLTVLQFLVPMAIVMMLVLTGVVLANSIIGGLVALFFMFGVVPVAVVTIVWVGLSIMINDEKE